MAKMSADRMLLASISVFRILVLHLERKGVISSAEIISEIMDIAETHRQEGDPNRIADAMDMLAQHIADSTNLQKREH